MAVPKKKTSKSKRNQRRSHDALKPVNVVIDKDSGEYRLSHHIDSTTGDYNGKSVVIAKLNKDEESE